ncbi:unnamed protein product [Brassica rapa subsp. trilocularis]
MNQVLLANHNTLLDLLEISQLMDTCVRNENFDEEYLYPNLQLYIPSTMMEMTMPLL